MKRIVSGMVLTAFMFTGLACAVDDKDKEAGETTDNFLSLRSSMIEMSQDIERFAKEMASLYGDAEDNIMGTFGDVKVDIADNGDTLTVKADLPGMEKDKIEVSLAGGRTLTIEGQREIFAKEETKDMVRQERVSGRFKRVIDLPVECKPQGIKANYENGVLTITLPKAVKTQEAPVKISVLTQRAKPRPPSSPRKPVKRPWRNSDARDYWPPKPRAVCSISS